MRDCSVGGRMAVVISTVILSVDTDIVIAGSVVFFIDISIVKLV